MILQLRSSDIRDGEVISDTFTCDGENISPQLSWTSVPENTKSFVLIMDDPDAPAGIWVHWIVYNIPANVSELVQNAGSVNGKYLPAGARQGVNSWGERKLPGGQQYFGPKPPPGKPHHYHFQLFALDVGSLPLKSAQATKARVTQAMEGHILARAEFTGIYQSR